MLGETDVPSWEISETPSKPSQSLQGDSRDVGGEGDSEEVGEERGGGRTAGSGTASK